MAFINVEIGNNSLSDPEASVLLEKLIDAYADGEEAEVTEIGEKFLSRLKARIIEEEARREKQTYRPEPYDIAIDRAVESRR